MYIILFIWAQLCSGVTLITGRAAHAQINRTSNPQTKPEMRLNFILFRTFFNINIHQCIKLRQLHRTYKVKHKHHPKTVPNNIQEPQILRCPFSALAVSAEASSDPSSMLGAVLVCPGIPKFPRLVRN